MDEIRSWVETSGYGRSLGVVVEDASPERWRFRLPYDDRNSNPGQALHGGCAASLGLIGAQAVARTHITEAPGGYHTAGLQVSYLAAAIGEDVFATATLLRRGKAVCFVEVDVETAEGKGIAHTTSMVRGRFDASSPELPVTVGDDGASEPGPMGEHVGKMPFMGGRGIVVEHMQGGHARTVMPIRSDNLDADGGVHEGAVLALLDTTGAMAAWSVDGPGPYKASTPTLQAQVWTPPPDTDLVAYGWTRFRDADAYWADVDVADASTGRVYVRGTVQYRIVQ
jgi:uncharacterized protein (TIGR00369 family)